MYASGLIYLIETLLKQEPRRNDTEKIREEFLWKHGESVTYANGTTACKISELQEGEFGYSVPWLVENNNTLKLETELRNTAAGTFTLKVQKMNGDYVCFSGKENHSDDWFVRVYDGQTGELISSKKNILKDLAVGRFGYISLESTQKTLNFDQKYGASNLYGYNAIVIREKERYVCVLNNKDEEFTNIYDLEGKLISSNVKDKRRYVKNLKIGEVMYTVPWIIRDEVILLSSHSHNLAKVGTSKMRIERFNDHYLCTCEDADESFIKKFDLEGNLIA